jgi:hypothetical protein
MDRYGNGRKKGKKKNVRLTVRLKNRERVELACTKDQLRATPKEWGGDEEKLTRTQKESQRKVCSTKKLNVSVSVHGRGGQ